MRYILKTDVDMIKYDGTNKDFIIDRLKIVSSCVDAYFTTIPSYFIIPIFGDWQVFDEELYKKDIIEIN